MAGSSDGNIKEDEPNLTHKSNTATTWWDGWVNFSEKFTFNFPQSLSFDALSPRRLLEHSSATPELEDSLIVQDSAPESPLEAFEQMSIRHIADNIEKEEISWVEMDAYNNNMSSRHGEQIHEDQLEGDTTHEYKAELLKLDDNSKNAVLDDAQKHVVLGGTTKNAVLDDTPKNPKLSPSSKAFLLEMTECSAADKGLQIDKLTQTNSSNILILPVKNVLDSGPFHRRSKKRSKKKLRAAERQNSAPISLTFESISTFKKSSVDYNPVISSLLTGEKIISMEQNLSTQESNENIDASLNDSTQNAIFSSSLTQQDSPAHSEPIFSPNASNSSYEQNETSKGFKSTRALLNIWEHPEINTKEMLTLSKQAIERVCNNFPKGKIFHNGYHHSIFTQQLFIDSKNRELLCSEEQANHRKTFEYQILEPLGKGSHGAVFLGKQWKPFQPIESEIKLALKIIDFEDISTANEKVNYFNQVLHEAYILKCCDHQNIVKYYESFCWPQNFLIIAVEYLPGGSLKELYQSYGPLPERFISYAMKDVLLALDYLHSEGFYIRVHRDIKAANILLDDLGNCKLIDFGVCCELTENSKCDEFVGTPQWMAPEVIKYYRGYNDLADIWSLGITAYELAFTHTPWPKRATLPQLLKVIANGKAPKINLNEGFDKEFCFFVERCLQHLPHKRSSAKELLEHVFIKERYQNEQRPRSLESWISQIKSINGKKRSSGLMSWLLPFLNRDQAKKEKDSYIGIKTDNLRKSFNHLANPIEWFKGPSKAYIDIHDIPKFLKRETVSFENFVERKQSLVDLKVEMPPKRSLSDFQYLNSDVIIPDESPKTIMSDVITTRESDNTKIKEIDQSATTELHEIVQEPEIQNPHFISITLDSNKVTESDSITRYEQEIEEFNRLIESPTLSIIDESSSSDKKIEPFETDLQMNLLYNTSTNSKDIQSTSPTQHLSTGRILSQITDPEKSIISSQLSQPSDIQSNLEIQESDSQENDKEMLCISRDTKNKLVENREETKSLLILDETRQYYTPNTSEKFSSPCTSTHNTSSQISFSEEYFNHPIQEYTVKSYSNSDDDSSTSSSIFAFVRLLFKV